MHTHKTYMKKIFITALIAGCFLIFTTLAVKAEPLNLLDPSSVPRVSSVSVASALQPWQSSQVASSVAGEKDYCVVATRFSNATTLILAVKNAGQTSLAIKNDASVFNPATTQNVIFTFPNGDQGRFVGRSDTPQSIIIQAGNDDYFWQNLIAHDHVNIAVQQSDFSAIYNIADIHDVRKKLLSCDMRVNATLSSADLAIEDRPHQQMVSQTSLLPLSPAIVTSTPVTENAPVNIMTNGVISRAVLPNDQDDLRLYHHVEKTQRQMIANNQMSDNSLVPDMPRGYIATNEKRVTISAPRSDFDSELVASSENHVAIVPNLLPAPLNALLQKTEIIPLNETVNTLTTSDRHISTWMDNRSVAGRFEQTFFTSEQVHRTLQSLAESALQQKHTACGGDFGFAPSISQVETIGGLSLVGMELKCRNIDKDTFFTGLFFTNKGTLSAVAFEGAANQKTMMKEEMSVIRQTLIDLDIQDIPAAKQDNEFDYVALAEQNIANPIYQKPVVNYMTLGARNNATRMSALTVNPIETKSVDINQDAIRPLNTIEQPLNTVMVQPSLPISTVSRVNSLSSIANFRSTIQTTHQAGGVVSPKPVANSLPAVLFGER